MGLVGEDVGSPVGSTADTEATMAAQKTIAFIIFAIVMVLVII